jgi:hypothetical protein
MALGRHRKGGIRPAVKAAPPSIPGASITSRTRACKQIARDEGVLPLMEIPRPAPLQLN